MAAKVWFITGTSKGFGRVWAEVAPFGIKVTSVEPGGYGDPWNEVSVETQVI